MTSLVAPCAEGAAPTTRPGRLIARRIPFDSIPREAWDRLLAATPSATPFSRWTFHRAWWDGYGASAHEDYMVCVRPESATGAQTSAPAPADPPAPALGAQTSEPAPAAERGPSDTPPAPAPTPGYSLPAPLDPDEIVAIVPLMHRHEVEPDDALFHTAIRAEPHTAQTALPGPAKAVFFAASYHADYATVLCDPADLPAVAAATVEELAAGPDLAHGSDDWDCIDLRRFRADDPALPAFEQAFCEAADRHGWEVAREQEEVCPVLRADDWDWETYLQTLSTKDRHEVRRKLRRAESAGPVEFEEVHDPSNAVDEFIALHQARWGAEGLFPDTEGGRRSRDFFRRLAELEGPDGVLRIGRLKVSGRVVFMCVGFHQDRTVYYYNAGNDPEAQALSPGIIGVAYYLQHEMAEGTRVFDFLRGNEGYKYRWGAQDEPIHRLIVTRRADG